MLNAMRKIFSERIADIIPTHDLGSEVKNPVTDHMKGFFLFVRFDFGYF